MNFMINRDAFFRKFLADRYLNSWLVLGCDAAVSVGSSLMVLLVSDLWMHHGFGRRFMLLWMLGAAAFSLLTFVGFKTYRTIIRYSTLRDIGAICMAVFGKDVLLGLFLWLTASFHMK